MAKPKITNAEGIHSQTKTKTTYAFYNEAGVAIHKTKEVFHKTKQLVIYPYTFQRTAQTIKPKRFGQISFEGFTNYEMLAADFKLTAPYGFKSPRARQLMAILNRKNKVADAMVISQIGKTEIKGQSIHFAWSDLLGLFRAIGREKTVYDSERKTMINNRLAKFDPSIGTVVRKLTSGQLEEFINKFDVIEKISNADADALGKFFDKLPALTISTTSHFIQAKERIDTVFMEDIIAKFKVLMQSTKDNEEEWQQFFQNYSWILTHLFPYQVILRKGKAYVGGKTLDNSDGRIVDFLFQNNLEDNCALLEIKTHKKDILKIKTYRDPDVFSVSDEMSGGVNQCLDQKDSFLRNMGTANPSYDPKCILVIGNKGTLSANQKKCFELYRGNQKNVDIVAFDELLAKLEGLFSVITGQVKKTKKR